MGGCDIITEMAVSRRVARSGEGWWGQGWCHGSSGRGMLWVCVNADGEDPGGLTRSMCATGAVDVVLKLTH